MLRDGRYRAHGAYETRSRMANRGALLAGAVTAGVVIGIAAVSGYFAMRATFRPKTIAGRPAVSACPPFPISLLSAVRRCVTSEVLPDGARYVGEVYNKVPDGHGAVVWQDGHTYSGDFRQGLQEGQGAEVWPDGRRYIGEFRDGKPNGQGTEVWADGRHYVGLFKDGAPDAGPARP